MSNGATQSQYPIAQFIAGLVDEYGLSRVELVRALGYRNGANRDRGLGRLDLWLDQGQGYNRILGEIAAAYPGHAEGLEKALAATVKARNEEAESAFLERCKAEQDRFTPYLHAEGESTVPNGITIFGITGGHQVWTTVELPKALLESPLDAQLAALPELMHRYKLKYC